MPRWTVSEPGTIDVEDPVESLRVRTVAGAVNVVATDGPARLEAGAVEGAPLAVTLEDGTLTVTYDDLAWDFSPQSLPAYVGSWRRGRRAVVSLAVPAGARVEVGTVSADSVVSAVSGPVTVRSVSGGTTLVRVSGPVEVGTVSGDIDAHSVSGDLKTRTVSGELTVVDGAGARLRATSVSGGMTVDLDRAAPSDVELSTIAGEVAVRVPDRADTEVEAGTGRGRVCSAFEELRITGSCGAKRLTGRLGAGAGRLRITTVSGSVALLRRPPDEDGATAPAGPDLTKSTDGGRS